jgi:four helix bundle protein
MGEDVFQLVEENSKAYNIRHRCFHFSKDIISFIQRTKFDRLYISIYDQLLRSATSIGANVVEGGAGSTRKDFANFFSIALKSANEIKYWLCIIRDTQPDIDKGSVALLLTEADELSKIIATILLNTRSKA